MEPFKSWRTDCAMWPRELETTILRDKLAGVVQAIVGWSNRDSGPAHDEAFGAR
jgi:hypothetical protein